MILGTQLLKKWNYKNHDYDDYKVPSDWHCIIYSKNMSEAINCPHCGKVINFGKSYTSIEIHNLFGIGYGVCKKCHDLEFERRRKYDGR